MEGTSVPNALDGVTVGNSERTGIVSVFPVARWEVTVSSMLQEESLGPVSVCVDWEELDVGVETGLCPWAKGVTTGERAVE